MNRVRLLVFVGMRCMSRKGTARTTDFSDMNGLHDLSVSGVLAEGRTTRPEEDNCFARARRAVQ